jgi:hypothetical protein
MNEIEGCLRQRIRANIMAANFEVRATHTVQEPGIDVG